MSLLTLTNPSRGGSSSSSYLGHIGTGLFAPNTLNGNTQANVYVTLRNRADPIDGMMQVGISNFYSTNPGGDIATGGVLTESTALEYPLGSARRRITYNGGASSIAIASGQKALADPIVAPPKGADYRIWRFVQNPAGLPLYGTVSAVAGVGGEFGTGALTDKTLTGSIGGLTSVVLSPTEIVGLTTEPTVLICGDSIQFLYDTYDAGLNGSRMDLGTGARSIGPFFGYSSIAVAGEQLTQFLTTSAMRRAASQYYSHIINLYGANDVGNSRTAAQFIADCGAFTDLFPGKKCMIGTLLPRQADATTTATTNPVRNTINNTILSGIRGYVAAFDLASAVEAAPRGSGLWRAANLTQDLLHPTGLGYYTIEVSRAINPGVIRR